MKKLSLALAITVMAASCYNDKEEEIYPKPGNSGCDTSNVTYKNTIQPIFSQSCAVSGCHDASQAAGFNLSTYDGAKAAVNSNKLIGAVYHQSGFSPMPKGGNKLDDCKLTQISVWVGQGAPNN
jgi:hypothetical protein